MTIYKDRASILQDIRKMSHCVSTSMDTGRQDKIIINIQDNNPRDIEVINMGRCFCIIIHYKNKVPCNIDTKSCGIDTAKDGSYQGMVLSPRSKAYAGFLDFYNRIKGGNL